MLTLYVWAWVRGWTVTVSDLKIFKPASVDPTIVFQIKVDVCLLRAGWLFKLNPFGFLQTSLPGILPGTSGVRLPHRGHLPGVKALSQWPPSSSTVCVCSSNMPPEGAVNVLFSDVKYSPVSHWKRDVHFYSMLGIWLISFICPSLFPSSRWIDCLFL